jgi:hypothetical protein
MEALMALLMLPIIVLNVLGGIIGGIWLLINGDWATFIRGLGYMVFGAFAVSILLLPGMILAVPMAKLLEDGRDKLAFVVGLPALLWTYVVVMTSCLCVFSWIMSRVEGSAIPYLLWSYAVATAPWSYMAQKDSQTGNDYGTYAVFGAQLGMISLFFAYLNNPHDLSIMRLSLWFAPFMLVTLLLSSFAAWVQSRPRSRLSRFDEF